MMLTCNLDFGAAIHPVDASYTSGRRTYQMPANVTRSKGREWF